MKEITLFNAVLSGLSRSILLLMLPGISNALGQSSDAFSYPAGNLVTKNGGSGWLGDWLSIGTATSPVITSTGLTFPAYTTVGGALLDTGGSYAATRQWFTPATGFANGSTVWFSCLVRADNLSTSDTLVLPFGDKGSTTSGHGIAFATKATANASTSSSDTYVYLRHGSSLYGTDGTTSGPGLLASLDTSKTILVVGRFTLSTSSNADVLDVWVNQTSTPTGDAPLRRTGFTASRSTSGSDGRALLYFGSAAYSAVDEFRIGLTYADVTTGLTTSAPPAITLDIPTDNQLFASPATIPLAATVTPGTATIKKVFFYNGATLLGEDATAPYSFDWTGVPASQPKLSARVVYDFTASQDADYVQQSATRSVYVLDNSPVTFAIDAAANRKPINPLIYGVNNITNSAQLRELNYTLNRRGGEVETRYDYQTNSHNIAKNWYFASSNASGTPASDVGRYIRATFDAQADVMVAVPTIGWMPKPGTHSFSQAKYGLQTTNEPYGAPDAGIGILQLDAAGNIIPYNPATAAADRVANVGNPTVELSPFHADPRFRSDRTDANYLPADPLAYQSGFIDTLISQWGLAANGGVRFYTLDNEPGLWDYIHRDVRGDANVTKEEIRDYIVAYGNMIRDRDPAAQILAPSEWGWAEADDYYPWLLAQLQANDTATGRRSLDILTVHYYAGYPGAEGSLDRLFGLNRSTRSLWDPNHTDETWINTKINLIPTLRSWVATYYPGTKIGITEYAWGYDDTIAGAVIQAEVLGIFGREGLDLATRWGSSANNPSNLIFKAMKMYRNYDGLRSYFGDTSVSSTTAANPDEINAFASERSADGALTILAVNKQPAGDRSTTFALSNFAHRGTAQAWRLDSAGTITRLADLTVSGNSLATSLPPQTITIYVLPAAANLIAPQVTGPVPANGALDVPTSLTVGWTTSANASLYHVYLGTNSAAVAAATTASPEYLGASATPDFDLTGLAGTTTCYWRVDAEATGGTTGGAVWSFTTSVAPYGTVTLTASDAFGSSSFASALNWNNAQAPSSANDYFTGSYQLRTPAGATGTTTFAGRSLTLNSGGKILTKGANNSTLQFPSLILAGGTLQNGDDNVTAIISGNLTVTANSTIDGDKTTRTFIVPASISGTQGLTIASSNPAGGGVVKITGENESFSGNWTINTNAILHFGNNAVTGGPGSGNITNHGQLIFNRSGNLTISGSISGGGSLTCAADLALTLGGNNTYTGPTTINAGSLILAGSLGITTVTIAPPATLTGSGTIAGNTTIAGTLSPGGNGIGLLGFGANLFLSGPTLVELDTSHPARHDSVSATGAINAGGTLAIVNTGPALVAGDIFQIFNKAYTGSFTSVSLPTLSGGLSWQNRLAIDGTLAVVSPIVGAATQPSPADLALETALTPTLSWHAGSNALSHRIYFGTNSAAVSTATTAAPEYKGEQTSLSWLPGTLAVSTTCYWRVDAVAGSLIATGPVWSFSTQAQTYGSVSLIKADSSGSSSFNTAGHWTNNLAPANTNDYLTAAYRLRTPAGSAANFTFAGHSLRISSGGEMYLKGNTGGTTTVASLILNGGKITNGTSSTTLNVAGAINVTAASTLNADSSGRTLALDSTISGPANLTVTSTTNSGGVVRLTGDNSSYQGNWTITSAATLRVGKGAGTGDTGSGNIGNSGKIIFNRSGNIHVGGQISGGGTLDATGAGILTLSGNNSYTGATAVTAGTLAVNGTLGATSVSIASAATLGGTGSIAGPVTISGALAPGNAGTGALSFGGDLSLSGTATFELSTASTPRHDSISVAGAFTAGGNLTISNTGPALVVGDTFPLFKKAYTGSFTAITLPPLTNGLVWQNDLATTGFLTVAALPVGPATDPIPADSATAVANYPTLSWTAGANAVSHTIYFGTSATAVANATPTSPEYQGNRTTPTWLPATLAGRTTYFWRIDETGAATTTPGSVWSFTTAITGPYLAWSATNGLTAGQNDDPLADPDHDNIPNLLEFILGGLPLTADRSQQPTVSTTATHATFTFFRSDASEPTTTLILQHGDTMADWTDIPIGAASSTAGTASVTIEENDANPDTVTISIPLSVSDKRFMRLKASRP